jgi:hypothetical protein
MPFILRFDDNLAASSGFIYIESEFQENFFSGRERSIMTIGTSALGSAQTLALMKAPIAKPGIPDPATAQTALPAAKPDAVTLSDPLGMAGLMKMAGAEMKAVGAELKAGAEGAYVKDGKAEEADEAEGGKGKGKGKAGKGKGKGKDGKKIPPGLAKKDPASLPDGNPWKAVLEEKKAEEEKQQKQEQLQQQGVAPQAGAVAAKQAAVAQQGAAAQQAAPNINPQVLAQLAQQQGAAQPPGAALALPGQPPVAGIGQPVAGIGQPVGLIPPPLSKAEQAKQTQQVINGFGNSASLNLLNAPNVGGNFGVVSALSEQVGIAKLLSGI